MTRRIDDLFGELNRPTTLGPVDWPEPAGLRHRAERRRAARRATVASGVALAAVAALATPLVLTDHGRTVRPASHPTTVAPAPVRPTHGAAPATPTTKAAPITGTAPAAQTIVQPPVPPDTALPDGESVTFGPVTVTLPKGWTATATDVPREYAQPAHEECLAPPPSPSQRSLDGCAGLEVWYDGFLPGAGSTSYESNREHSPAWAHGPGTPTCPATGTTPGPKALDLGGPDVWDWQWIGGTGAKSAVHNAWTVRCADGTTFSPQAWLLPVSHLLFFSYAGNPEAAAILPTVRIR